MELMHFRKTPLVLATRCFVLLGLFTAFQSGPSATSGQDWPVRNPPVTEPVPQYVPRTAPRSIPRYPLEQSVEAQPSPSDVHSPDPTMAITPLTPLQTNIPRSDSNSQIAPGPLTIDTGLGTIDSGPGTIAPGPGTIAPGPRMIKTPGSVPKSVESDRPGNHNSVIDYSVYRDRNPIPIDPRKPCNHCLRPPGTQTSHGDLPGRNGRPYIGQEPGGCECGKHNPAAHPDFSVHWPRPFSARLDDRFPSQAAARAANCPQHRLVDVFDSLATFKLIDYQRRDNGYCGPGADPYGCVGESRQR